MSRYIDADKLIEEIKERIKAAIEWGKSAETEEIKIRAEQAIATFCEASLTAKKLPTADVVEVVRCKRCKKYNTDDCMMIHGKKMNRNIFANDFCSYGERADE